MLTAWLVHLYTASGALFAFLALNRIFYDRYQDAFFWLFLAVVVDATDGVLARRGDVGSRLPGIDGAKLDDIVDYLTYVFVPAFFVWHALLVPDRWSTLLVGAMLLSSAYAFSRDDAKTDDGFFTGFPSCWNIVAFYLHVAGWSPEVNAAIVVAFVILVCVPIRYVYPTRTVPWRTPTIGLGAVWALLMFAMLWQMPTISPPIFWASFVFPIYYVTLSVALHLKRRRDG
ncbi:MAG: CDP-diacylglycerol O-phosphatidyltransferase [Acidobacteria bacterium]|nr:CDP-diacylglycerol O-phosphatidyltransferase [Acidobacteriota bacterium]